MAMRGQGDGDKAGDGLVDPVEFGVLVGFSDFVEELGGLCKSPLVKSMEALCATVSLSASKSWRLPSWKRRVLRRFR